MAPPGYDGAAQGAGDSRAHRRDGSRLNPRKGDLHRWRETLAEKLRGYGIEAEASRQATRGENRRFEALWRVKAKEEGRLLESRPRVKSGDAYLTSRNEAFLAWGHIMEALTQSDRPGDQALARDILRFARESPYLRNIARPRGPARPVQPAPEPQRGTLQRTRPDIDIVR